MTGAEILMQRGHDQGLQQGQRDMLLLQLQERFGQLPTDIVERVKNAKPEQLLLWARRFASTQGLDVDELFAEPSP